MNEFLKINWRVSHPSQLECYALKEFLPDEALQFSDNDSDSDEEKYPKIFRMRRVDYTPGLQEIKSIKIQSGIDQRGHQVCLEALKLFQSGKDRSCYTYKENQSAATYDKLKMVILQENAKYLKYVAQQWQEIDYFKQYFNENVTDFGKCIWHKKKLRLKSYPQFYKELLMINTSLNEEEEIIEFNCVENNLQLEGFAQFCNPGLKSPCQLNTIKLESEKDKVQLPLNEDEGVLNYIQDVDVVISSSSIKHLVDTTESGKWLLPVVIKTINNKQVAFFEKPFSLNDVSNKDLAQTTYKRLIQKAFCLPEPKPKPTYRKWLITKTHCLNSLMKTHHKPVNLKVLIRNKTVASETINKTLQDVILKPKIEMQLKYGANIQTKSELIGEWASLFFRPFSNLYRVRISPVKGEVICLEKCHIQKVIAEAQHHYHYKPQLGLATLQKVFEDVSKLPVGNYLLRHLPKQGNFISVLKQSDKQEFDFYKELDQRSLSDCPNWVPLDCNFILPGFEALNRMPGMFQPRKTNLKRKMQTDVG
ncbi:unnamed protein product [Ceutorhynchus assimilis]|uniref:Little elongation complex subunit 2 C-terminal domain-containing protein n=1 Tax=Ceutorhynchus assimilis TaxID=467358 RepID=A0A9N9MG02_9CUCU|nr:unnamed protein product [Ceutorhynchus assimilis]